MRALKYTSDGIVHYKLNHTDDQLVLPEPRRARIDVVQQNVVVPTCLFTDARPIAESKWKHLQELKAVVPRDYHTFYDNLRH